MRERYVRKKARKNLLSKNKSNFIRKVRKTFGMFTRKCSKVVIQLKISKINNYHETGKSTAQIFWTRSILQRSVPRVLFENNPLFSPLHSSTTFPYSRHLPKSVFVFLETKKCVTHGRLSQFFSPKFYFLAEKIIF